MPYLAVHVNPAAHREFKLWCFKRGLKMSEVLRQLARDWVVEQERLEKLQQDLEAQRRE